MNRNKSKQVNNIKRKFVDIDPEIHRRLKVLAASEKTTIKALTECAIIELLGEIKL